MAAAVSEFRQLMTPSSLQVQLTGYRVCAVTAYDGLEASANSGNQLKSDLEAIEAAGSGWNSEAAGVYVDHTYIIYTCYSPICAFSFTPSHNGRRKYVPFKSISRQK